MNAGSLAARAASLCALAVLAAATAGCSSGWALVVGAPEVEPSQVQALQAASPRPLILDMRDAQAYEAGHIAGAVRVELSEIAGYLEAAGPPRATPVVLVCTSGWLSVDGAVHAARKGYSGAASLAGGMLRWQQEGLPLQAGPGVRPAAELLAPPRRHLTLARQVVVFTNGLVVKPIHMLLSLLLIILLWRRNEPDLRLFRWALIVFLAGESACALNYLFTDVGEILGLELAHDAGMIALGALLPWGFLRTVDDRVLHFSRPGHRCSFRGLCGACGDPEPAICKLARIARWAALGLALLCFIPLSAPLRPANQVLVVFGDWVGCVSTVHLQVFEFRLFPAVALVLFLMAALRLRGRRADLERAQPVLFVGLGFLSFSMVRFLLVAAYEHSPGWDWWWEEATELLTVGVMALVLYQFRDTFDLRWPWRRTTEPRA